VYVKAVWLSMCGVNGLQVYEGGLVAKCWNRRDRVAFCVRGVYMYVKVVWLSVQYSKGGWLGVDV